MADGNDGHPFFDNKVSSILLAVGSAVSVVTIYRLLSICLFNQHLITNQDATTDQLAPNNNSAAASVSHLIPTHKYEKKKKKKKKRKRKNELEDDGGGDEADDCTCAVCLGDFEEGEELKTLPECMHSFHASCIDMWLHSHSSCPICRAEAAPQTQLTDDEHHHHNIEIMQIAPVQDRLGRG